MMACAQDTPAYNGGQADELGKLFEDTIEDQVVLILIFNI